MKQKFKCKLGYARALTSYSRLRGVVGYYSFAMLFVIMFLSFSIVETGYRQIIGILLTAVALLIAKLPLVRAFLSKMIIDDGMLYAHTGLFGRWKVRIADIQSIGYRAEVPFASADPQRLMQRFTQKHDYQFSGDIIFSGYVIITPEKTYTFPFDLVDLEKFLDGLHIYNSSIGFAKELPKIGVEKEKSKVRVIRAMFWVAVVLLIPLFFGVLFFLFWIFGELS